MHNTTEIYHTQHDDRIVEYLKHPETGPELLFFSGGSAIRSLCQCLQNYTHNSIHLLTPFDSGGSTAELRKFLDMPAVGDVRSRLLALISPTQTNYQLIMNLFNYRLLPDSDKDNQRHILNEIASGDSSLIKSIDEVLKSVICRYLALFMSHIDHHFNFDGACIGNLILAGGYLSNNHQLEPVIFEFSELLTVQGKVRLTVNNNYHLTAALKNGRRVLGQHRITGKEHPPIESSIQSLELSSKIDSYSAVGCKVSDINRKTIENANLICFPPGSFYSSIIANLLPEGVTQAIAKNPNPKVYIPNLGIDPESRGLTINQNIQQLMKFLSQNKDLEKEAVKEINLTHILLDNHDRYYNGSIQTSEWRDKGIEVVRTDLTSKRYMPYYDPHKLVQAILSLM